MNLGVWSLFKKNQHPEQTDKQHGFRAQHQKQYGRDSEERKSGAPWQKLSSPFTFLRMGKAPQYMPLARLAASQAGGREGLGSRMYAH